PRLVSVVATQGSESELIQLVASLEQGSEHPLGAAVIRSAKERGLALIQPDKFSYAAGRGVHGSLDGKVVLAGNEAFLEEYHVATSGLAPQAMDLRRQGQTVIFAAVDGHAAGLLGIADPIKPSTPGALQDLRAEGLHIVMLTGDNHATAE